MDRHDWVSQETPVSQKPSIQASSASPVTGVLAVGGIVENRFCTWGPNPQLDYWGGNIQVNEPSQLPAKTVRIQYLNPSQLNRWYVVAARTM